jgi:hypothetical protein
MSIIPDELKRQTFPCPACGQIISTDVSRCKACDTEIDESLMTFAVRKELGERSLARLKNHKFYMAAGVVAFGAGVFTLLMPWVEAQLGSRIINFSCWTPLLLIGGIGAFVMGLTGYLREKRYLDNV